MIFEVFSNPIHSVILQLINGIATAPWSSADHYSQKVSEDIETRTIWNTELPHICATCSDFNE